MNYFEYFVDSAVGVSYEMKKIDNESLMKLKIIGIFISDKF